MQQMSEHFIDSFGFGNDEFNNDEDQRYRKTEHIFHMIDELSLMYCVAHLQTFSD